MKKIILEHAAGFIATTNPDGTARVSIKGTMLTHEDDKILFADIRSPGTLRNLAERPNYEINFLDILSRRCVRASGTAQIFKSDSENFNNLMPKFQNRWPDLAEKIRAIVCLKVEKSQLVLSPSYDVGETEDSLRKSNAEHYKSLM